uniref:FPL domain-containing protein n=1 Tax=Glossina palpalis gambiensis TaxID=67801 RepID=A0A1B0AXI1_9MUSC
MLLENNSKSPSEFLYICLQLRIIHRRLQEHYQESIQNQKHTTVEYNMGLLVESLRSTSEILIWSDQHDSSVFDFFSEKNMLSYFLHIMRQKSGGSSFVCVQLLQTLNILFEDIRNETSLCKLMLT